jgi:hypothetical protein
VWSLDLRALLLTITANTAPVLLCRALSGGSGRPIDGSLKLWDGRPLFGPHKTWRGLIAGIIFTGAAGISVSVGFLAGAAFGAFALAGDLFSSFIKRRLGRPSGAWIPFIDQVPEALFPMLVLQHSLGLEQGSILGTVAVFAVLDMITSKITPNMGDAGP